MLNLSVFSCVSFWSVASYFPIKTKQCSTLNTCTLKLVHSDRRWRMRVCKLGHSRWIMCENVDFWQWMEGLFITEWKLQKCDWWNIKGEKSVSVIITNTSARLWTQHGATCQGEMLIILITKHRCYPLCDVNHKWTWMEVPFWHR